MQPTDDIKQRVADLCNAKLQHRPAPVDPDRLALNNILNVGDIQGRNILNYGASLTAYRKHKAEAIRPWRELVERVQGDSTTWCQGWERWHTDARALLEKTNGTD